MNIKKPRGTRDFPPSELAAREYIKSTLSQVFEAYNYQRIQTPTFEHAELFQLKSGEEIEEHMYVFEDKSSRKLCLRPEATASVCRMFSEELRSIRLPLKLYYYGPMFRYERPQKGRYREFWQIGMELIGPQSPESDAETILLAYDSLTKLGLTFTLEIGHMGIIRGLMSDLKIDENIQNKVIACIDKGDISQLEQLVDNPVIHDLIKLKGSVNVITQADNILNEYKTAKTAFNELKEVLEWLDNMGTEYCLNLGIARGLEYYTGTVFEIQIPKLGAQSQICGGGRYDNLIELFSGLKIPAVGFAFGFDRIMNAIKLQGIKIPEKRADLVAAPVNNAMRQHTLKIISPLRDTFIVDFDVMNRKLDKILKYAGDIQAKYVLIVGPEDLKDNQVTLRNMGDGKQEKIKITDLENRLTKLCR